MKDLNRHDNREDIWMENKNTKRCWTFLSVVCMCAKLLQLCPTLPDPMDCSPPGSSVHWVFQARILAWVAMSFSRGSSLPRELTLISCVSCITGGFLTHWVIGKANKCDVSNLCVGKQSFESNGDWSFKCTKLKSKLKWDYCRQYVKHHGIRLACS